jgi:hypothetical protein
VYFLLVPVYLLYTLVLVGCISDSAGIPNIFVVAIPLPGGSEIRVGHLGMFHIRLYRLYADGPQACVSNRPLVASHVPQRQSSMAVLRKFQQL